MGGSPVDFGFKIGGACMLLDLNFGTSGVGVLLVGGGGSSGSKSGNGTSDQAGSLSNSRIWPFSPRAEFLGSNRGGGSK